jgi:hypothetical protein
MKKDRETLAMNGITRNIEEWIALEVRGQPCSIYQKRIFGGKAGGW